MSQSGIPARRLLGAGGLLAVALLLTGCAGMEPYEARDEREEGPEQGLFSGEDGEFVLFRSTREPNPDEEEDESETTSGE